jgi:hypothetical protein
MRHKFKDRGQGFWTEDGETRFRVRQSVWMYSVRWVEVGWKAVEISDDNQRQLHSLNTHRKATESGAHLPEEVTSLGHRPNVRGLDRVNE